MRLSLSTNWFRSPDMEAAEIVDRALAMGFEELELGFATPQDVGEGFKRIAGRIRYGSVHAFCPIPLSAPVASPELYPLASLDPEERALAKFHLLRSAKFAAEVGADAVVLHAGRVPLATLFHRDMGTDVLRGTLIDNSKDVNAKPYAKMLDKALAVRRKRGARLLDVHGLTRAHRHDGAPGMPVVGSLEDDAVDGLVFKHLSEVALFLRHDSGNLEHFRRSPIHGTRVDVAYAGNVHAGHAKRRLHHLLPAAKLVAPHDGEPNPV